MLKYDIGFYVAVYIFMVLLALCVIGEEKPKPKEVNITNPTIKVEIKK